MNTIKFYIKNRFVYVMLFVMFGLSYCVVSNNPYLNVLILGVVFSVAVCVASYLFEKPNASERLTLQKLTNMFAEINA